MACVAHSTVTVVLGTLLMLAVKGRERESKRGGGGAGWREQERERARAPQAEEVGDSLAEHQAKKKNLQKIFFCSCTRHARACTLFRE